MRINEAFNYKITTRLKTETYKTKITDKNKGRESSEITKRSRIDIYLINTPLKNLFFS